jgi:hypothetical protein
MTDLVRVIHDFPCRNKGVDGRDKPGHDGAWAIGRGGS